MDPQEAWVAQHKGTPLIAVAIDAAFLIFDADNIKRFCAAGFGSQLIARDELMHVGVFKHLYIPQLTRDQVMAHLDDAVRVATEAGIEHASEGKDELVHRYYDEGGSTLFQGPPASPNMVSFFEMAPMPYRPPHDNN